MNGNNPPPPPEHVYLCFVGIIQFPWTQCLRNILANCASQNAKAVTILMSSPGGSIVEGFALYNFIRALPFKCSMHNIGSVQSIANIVFLAGDRRTAAKHSSFMLHNLTWTFAQETLTVPQVSERIMNLDTARSDFTGIFEERTLLKPADFDTERFFENPKVMDPAAALKSQVIHAVEDLKIPPGSTVLNVVQGP